MYAARSMGALLRSILPPEWRLLLTIERFMLKYEYVPFDLIERHSELKPSNARTLLERMSEKAVLRKGRIASRAGYNLTYIGYDMLALRALSDRDIVQSVGLPIAVGKESDVFDGMGGHGKRIAIKMFRIGRVSFRNFRKLREYPRGFSSNWLQLSKEAARRESRAYDVLERLAIPVAKIVGTSRHIVVTQAIEGVLLTESPVELTSELLRRILGDIRRMFVEAGIVHNDLSAYNIMLDSAGNHYFIDFPQWVHPSHANSPEFLSRDVRNIVMFFRNRGVKPSAGLEELEAYVRGEHERI